MGVASWQLAGGSRQYWIDTSQLLAACCNERWWSYVMDND